jgi:integrase/recombinase XerC
MYQWHSGKGSEAGFERSQVFNLALAKSGTAVLESLALMQVSSAFARIASATGTRFSPHRLRHTLATQLVHAEVDLVHIKEMLGHADLKTTAGYIEPSLGRLKSAVERLTGP